MKESEYVLRTEDAQAMGRWMLETESTLKGIRRDAWIRYLLTIGGPFYAAHLLGVFS